MDNSYSEYDEDENQGIVLTSDSLLDSRPKEKSIAADLAKYDIPEDIIARADILYKEDQVDSFRICRQKKRKKLLFYFTLKAYRELYHDVDPNKIAKPFGLTQGDTMTAVSTFNKKKTSSDVYFCSPIKLTERYCEELSIKDPEIISEILRLCATVIEKEPNLINNYPQTIAAGVIWYFFQAYNYDPHREKFESIVGRSSATIKKMAKLVGEIDNK